MKWKGRQGSSNVENKRGMSGKGVAGIGGGVGGTAKGITSASNIDHSTDIPFT